LDGVWGFLPDPLLQFEPDILDLSRSPKAHYNESLQAYPRRGSRWQGDWTTSFSWLCHDKLFRDLPTQGGVDFAFADLTPEQVITGFTPFDFAADVYAGLFVGWIHHPVALIGTRRFGDGLLLVCTFRLSAHIQPHYQHPVAILMLRDMLAHLAAARP
jgi:hypothetical protein